MKDLVCLLSFFRCSIEPGNMNKWWWTEADEFSCASAYITIHNKGQHKTGNCGELKFRWRLRFYLVNAGGKKKILTQDVLIYQRCLIQQGCHICGSNIIETRDQIMWNYAYAGRFWMARIAHFNLSFRGGENILEIWIMGQVDLQPEPRVRWNII